MKHETTWDPMTGFKWTRRTTGRITEELDELGIDVSANTVGKLLKQMGLSLRVNHKKLSHGSHADRDEQFTYIAQRREGFTQTGDPIVSIHTKKRELVGSFMTAWNREPVAVNDHDRILLQSDEARRIGVVGTPSTVVGRRVIVGVVPIRDVWAVAGS